VSDSVDAISSRAAIRGRPGMYIGDPEDGSGLQNLVLEVVSNALDQCLIGRCSAIHVAIDDDLVTVRDDGPSLALDSEEVRSYLTTLHRTATADGHAPHVHLAVGVGFAVVNALSARFEVEVVHGGRVWRTAYEQGLVVEPLTSEPSEAPTGTPVRLRPDPAIFRTTTRISRGALTERLELLTFLVPTLRLTWSLAPTAPHDAAWPG
jgi:DNA gyrase subunit B